MSMSNLNGVVYPGSTVLEILLKHAMYNSCGGVYFADADAKVAVSNPSSPTQSNQMRRKDSGWAMSVGRE